MAQRPGDTPLHMLRVSRLVPRADSVLQLPDNLIGDRLINISHGSSFSVLVAAAAGTCRLPGVARARRLLRPRNAEASPEGPLLEGIRVDAAGRVGMPCTREGQRPLKPKKRRGVWGGAKRRASDDAETGKKRYPQEREQSDAAGSTRDRVPRARRSLSLARRIVTRRVETRHPVRNLRGSVTPAKADGVEPDRRSRSRRSQVFFSKDLTNSELCFAPDAKRSSPSAFKITTSHGLNETNTAAPTPALDLRSSRYFVYGWVVIAGAIHSTQAKVEAYPGGFYGTQESIVH
jgi:hypothetical protein